MTNSIWPFAFFVKKLLIVLTTTFTHFISALKHSPSRKGRKDISFKRAVQSHQRTVSITNETDQQATLSSTSAPAAAVADAEEETALASADKLEITTATATSNEGPSTNDGKNTI